METLLMRTKDFWAVAIIFMLIGIAGRMSFEDEVRSEAEQAELRQHILTRVEEACAKAQSCYGVPDSFLAAK